MAGAEWQFSIQCQVSPAMYFFSCLFFMGRGCLETKRGSNLALSLLCVFTLVWCNPLALFEMTQVSKPVMSESAGCILRPASELVFTEKLISKGSGPAAQASACRTLPEHNKKRGGKKEGIREIPGRVKHTTGQQGLASSKSTVWNPREPPPPLWTLPPPFLALVWFERSVRVWERSLGIPFFIKGHYYSIALNTQALCLVQRARAGGGAEDAWFGVQTSLGDEVYGESCMGPYYRKLSWNSFGILSV